MHDIAIIGGGPGGYVAAIRAAQLGAKVVLIEEGNLGGVCLNRGCIPTKALLHSSSLYASFQNAGRFGIEAGPLRFDYAKMTAHKDRTVKMLVNGVGRLLAQNGVEVIQGRAELISETEIEAADRRIMAKSIIIAVGSEPALPPIPGLDSAAILTSDDALELTEVPASIAIVGGGVIGVELAILFRDLGVEVTIIEMLDRLVSVLDEELSKGISDLLKRKGVKFFTGARVERIEGQTLYFTAAGAPLSLTADKVLIATGRRSNGLKLGLEKLGIAHERGMITTDERLRTNLPGVYAIGDVTGRMMLAHAASAQGIVAVENIMGRERVINYQAIPACIYTSPEVATVGWSEAEAVAAKRKYKSSRFPLSAIGKALAEGQTQGFIKLLADSESGILLGAHIFAPHATDMIAHLATAIEQKIPYEALSHTVFPHPTYSEMIGEAVHGLIDGAIHV